LSQKTKPIKKKKNKGPGSLTDTENKTHQKKNKGPSSLTNTENKTHQKKSKKKKKKVCAGPGSARKLPGQTERQTCNFNI
jgi:hypothetical protein